MSELSNKEKNWGALAHLGVYVSWLIPLVGLIIYLLYYNDFSAQFKYFILSTNPVILILPLVLVYIIMQFVPAFVILLSKGHNSIFVGHHARESLNFLISTLVAYFVCALLGVVVLGILTSGGKDLMAILALIITFGIVVILFYVIFWPIVAAIKASKGELYRYRFSIRFI